MAYRDVLFVLADPTRREIFELLKDGPSSVGDLAAQLPVSRPAVSQHLKVLKSAGLVREEPVGTRRIYMIRPEGLLDLQRWVEGFCAHVFYERSETRGSVSHVGAAADRLGAR